MEFFWVLSVLQLIFWVVIIFIIIYLVFKRIEDKKKETFDNRDN
ncbi:MAG: preprotein translocase subunit YajC [Saprospiraceae bacterium]|jgi:preprotein translocase subunit YajC